MPDRRRFLKSIPLAAVALTPAAHAALRATRGDTAAGIDPLRVRGDRLLGPPVVQNPSDEGFTVTFRVTGLATGEVAWGLGPTKLEHRAQAAIGGLISADDEVLSVRVDLAADQLPANGEIYYRVGARALAYQSAYKLSRGEVEHGPVHRLKLPHRHAAKASLVCVNDTHERTKTLDALIGRTNQLDPDLIAWNGDTCNDFDAADSPSAILLGPGSAGDDPHSEGWATRRPLLYVPGNHEMRGARAREVGRSMQAWSGGADLPYNFVVRHGPLALIGLESGEDKPDTHPVFAGTAAYHQHRRRQARWLSKALERDDVRTAPFKVALVHIPLRGLPGQNDGMTHKGYARWSGEGAKLWTPLLHRAGIDMVISGHTHKARIQDPEGELLRQVVGGGPSPRNATLIYLAASAQQLDVRIEDFNGKTLDSRTLET